MQLSATYLLCCITWSLATTLTLVDFWKWNSLYIFFLPFSYFISVILNSVDERGQPWHNLLVSANFDSLDLHFINYYFFFFKSMSTIALNNVSGMFLDFIISNSVLLYYKMLFWNLQTTSVFPNYIPLRFSINNLRQNVGSVYENPFQNPFCISVVNCFISAVSY